MTLEALGRQYAAEADNLTELVALCKERRKAAMRDGNSCEAFRLDKLAEMHASQQADIQQISAWLQHYYDDSSDDFEQQTAMKGQLVLI